MRRTLWWVVATLLVVCLVVQGCSNEGDKKAPKADLPAVTEPAADEPSPGDEPDKPADTGGIKTPADPDVAEDVKLSDEQDE